MALIFLCSGRYLNQDGEFQVKMELSPSEERDRSANIPAGSNSCLYYLCIDFIWGSV